MVLTTSAVQLRPALDPVHDTQAVFRVLLDALSQPGAWHQVPVAAAGAPANPWAASVLLTVLDHETSFVALAQQATQDFVRARTNAKVSPLEVADFLLSDASALTAEAILALKRGSLAYPDDSATLIVDTSAATIHTEVRLSGPGIVATRQVRIGLSPEALNALTQSNANYPCGIDVLIVEASGQLLGLPRTTRFGER